MISLRGLHPFLRPGAEDAVRWARAYGVEPRITSVRRTWSQQSELYDKHMKCRREGKYPHGVGCHYPANPPGWSAHQYGLAFDSTVPGHAESWWRDVRQNFGFRVPPHDRIHAEHPEAQRYVRYVNERL
jgi:hypothetical protein